MIDRLHARALEPTSAASLVAYRWAFGLLMTLGAIRFAAEGWIDQLYVAPQLTLGYPGLEWIVPLPGAGMYALFAALAVLGLAIAAGVRVRASALLFALGFTYVELLDQTCYLNHYYLVTILALLLAALPVERGTAVIPRWWLWVLRAQVGLVYVFAGLAKLGPDWLLDAQPMSIWLSTMELPIVGDLVAHPAVAYAASWAGMLFDLAIVPLLLVRRTRALAFVAVVAFHVATWLMFPIGLFPWIMIANATLLCAPDWPRRWWRRVDTGALLAPAANPATPRWLVHLLALHLVVQLLVPLRHVLYPGDVLWTGEGLRWSWKVMIVEKAGIARFEVVDPATGRRWLEYPRTYLTPRQEKMLAVEPELIRQFAHHLAARYRARGVSSVQVFADVEVAFNGRRRQRLVDPHHDLAAEPFAWGAYPWILTPSR